MRLVKQPPKPGSGLAVDQYPFKLILQGEEVAHLHVRDAAAIMQWGNETFGPFVKNWAFSSARMRENIITAYFRSEADALVFAMRWMHGHADR